MAITAEQQSQLQQLFLGTFNMPLGGFLAIADEVINAGMTIDEIAEVLTNTPAFASIYPADVSFGAELLDNLMGNTVSAADKAGLAAAIDELVAGGWTKAQVITTLTGLLADPALVSEPTWGAAAQQFQNKIAVAEYYTNAGGESFNVAELQALVDDVTDDAGSVTSAQNSIDSMLANVFTLTESMTEGANEIAPVTAVYWGYNPNSTEADNSTEGPSDGGIPVADLIEFVTTITGLDLAELGLVDDDGNGPFDNVTELEIELGGDLTVTFEDGSSLNAEVALGDEYMTFLNNLLFDSEGNSRLYEKVMVDGVEEKLPVQQAIVLTPTENNGGTIEDGVTSNASDTIVAGRLDLLHGAYIDGGGGYNTLEIDAKGVYAQPKELLNIQAVKIENLPNVYTATKTVYTYTDENGDVITGDYLPAGYVAANAQDPAHADFDPNYAEATVTYSTYPATVQELNATQGNANSIIDLSRATSIQTLTITEGNFEGLGGQDTAGTLTVAGIRNGATTTLDGGFTQDVTLHYSEASDAAGINLVFHNLSMGDELDDQYDPVLNVAHNAETLNIESTGAGNFLHMADLGGVLSTLNITGDAQLYIKGDLDASFHDDNPVTIDASANTGGVNLQLTNSEKVTILGSQGNDTLLVTTSDASRELVPANGNDDSLVIVDMMGDNHIEASSTLVDLTVGDGDNIIELGGQVALVTAGDGDNSIAVESAGMDEVTITVGNGDNSIEALNTDSVTITTGDGDNDVLASGTELTITTGAGNDTIAIAGLGDDYASASALITVNTGSGVNTLHLGWDYYVDSAAITANEGSSITGENITLVVHTESDLRAASLNGITSIMLDDNVDDAVSDGPALLTVTDQQLSNLMTNGLAVNVEGSIFNTSAHINVIVTDNLDLTTGAWAALLADLPASVDLMFEINDGAQLKITAEQLHTKVAPQGISIADDSNTDTLSGSVLITGAGPDFDPFNNSDQVRTNIDGREYIGGSLATGTFGFATDTDAPADGIQRDEWGYNVLVDRTMSGYNRPADALSYSRLTIDTDQQSEIGPFSTIETFLRIIGDADLTFTPMEGGIDDWGRPIEGGTSIQLGIDNGAPTNTYMVDFSAVGGDVINLTLGNFEMADAIFGNGSASNPVRVNVELGGDVASAEQGLVSRDVQTYVVTDVDVENDIVNFFTCTTTQDLQTLGIQGLVGETVNFLNTERGVDFLIETEYSKADGYAAGTLHADFARDGADAVINIVALDTVPEGQVQVVDGITTTNADTVTINAVNEYIQATDANGNLLFEQVAVLDANGNPTFVQIPVLDANGDPTYVQVPVLDANGNLTYEQIPVLDANGDPTYVQVPVLDANGQPTYEQIPVLDANGDPTYEQVPVLDANGQPTYEQVRALDANGNPAVTYRLVVDENGDPVTQLGPQFDANGNPLLDANGDPILGQNPIYEEIPLFVNGDQIFVDGDQIFVDGDQIFVNGAQIFDQGDQIFVDGAQIFNQGAQIFANGDPIMVPIGGDTEITTLTTNEATDLTITAGADVVLVTVTNSANLDTIDASGIDGDFTMSTAHVGGADDFTFTGSAGTTELTFTADFTASEDSSITSAGTINVIADSDVALDLAAADISGIDSITLDDAASVTLTIEQAEAIGAANFIVALGDSATLNLEGLNDQQFALANYDVDGTLAVTLTLADEDVVTLHPDTDLTGVATLEIPEGTTLYLSAAQYQELDGAGFLTGDGSVVITGLTQADVGEAGADFDISGIVLGADSTITLQLADSVDLSEATLTGVDTITFGDDMMLTLGDIQVADGVEIVGGANSTLKFTDLLTIVGEDIDASGFDVANLMFTNTLTMNGNINIDDIFTGLSGSIEKMVYMGKGSVATIDQVVYVEAGSTATDSLAFNPAQIDVELNSLTLNLMGGSEIDGDLGVGTDVKFIDANDNDAFDAGETELLRSFLQSVVINSEGTAVNLLSGETANVITGDLSPAVGGAMVNNLLDLTINASQELIIEGDVVFASNVGAAGGDSFASNDIEDAVAVLTVNGDADVTLGGIDTSDADVDGLNVINNGTGTLSLTVNAADIDAGDDLAFTGTGAIELTVVGAIDFSDDDLAAVTEITVAEDAALTLSFAQVSVLGAANIVSGDTDDIVDEVLNINAYDGSAFDFSALSDELVVTLTMASGVNALDPAVDLTGVDSIIVPEGGTLTLTAAQFQQLNGNGMITGLDADGNVSTDFTVSITDLGQANVDLDVTDPEGTAEAGDGFKLTDVAADNITVTLAEDVNLDANTDLNGAAMVIDSFHLGLATHAQADDLVVTGDAASIVSFLFDIDFGNNGEIEAGGYDIGTLRAIANTVAGLDVEVVIDNLANSVELSLYETAEQVGYVSPIHRVVTIEDGVAVPGALIFNGLDDMREMRTLTINFEGDANDGRTVLEDQDGNLEGSVIEGDLILDRTVENVDLVPRKLQSLTLNSFGAGDSNGITGDITAFDSDGAGPNLDNNLLAVEINADSDFTIGGDILFSSTDVDDATATLTINGAADVEIEQLNVADTDVDALVVNNDGTGTLTVTGASPAIVGPVETVTLSGTGDIVLGDHDGATLNTGIEDDTLSLIDASGLTGDLDMGEVADIDDADFTFTAGTGVTIMTYSESDAIAAYDVDDAPGIVLDFSDAAAGSELHLDAAIGNVDATSRFTVLADANTTIYIDATMDLSGFAASLPQGVTIVLAAGVDLTLTAAQADGLTIIPDASVVVDEADPDFLVADVPTVTITELGDAAYNFSNIMAGVQGTIDAGTLVVSNAFLEDNDVTINALADLGDVGITLADVADGVALNDDLAGQTVRFNTAAQAERIITVDNTVLPGQPSTNVVWLFQTAPANPVDTSDYDANITRLWLTQALSNGANIEDLFTTLPDTIIRVDFANLSELDILLNSQPVDREVELASFTSLPAGLIFNDQDILEHVQNLTISMGGQVTVGDLEIDNIIDNTVNPVAFNTLTIESWLADDSGDLLARENFDETINVKPNSGNTIGDISVGADNNFDLLNVVLDTNTDEAGNNLTALDDAGNNVLTGTSLTVGDITFDSEVAAETATLTLAGANDITIASVDTSDADITTFDLEVGGFTGVLDPVLHLDNTETFTISDTASVGVADLTFSEVEGNELSFVDFSASNDDITITFSQIDSTNEDRSDPLDGDTTDAGDAAFNFTASAGVNTVVVGAVGANVPTLAAASTWAFDMTGAAAGSSLTFDATTSLAAGSNLVVALDANSVLNIDGALDLSAVNLTVTGGAITVGAGDTLTLTVDQVAALAAAVPAVEISGAGKVVIVDGVSNGTDFLVAYGGILRTAEVDLAALTFDDPADPLAVTMNAAGGLDDAGDPIGQTVTGTTNADTITVTAEANVLNGGNAADALVGGAGNDTFNGGAGNDTLTGNDGSNTFNVTSGTDTITDLYGDAVGTPDPWNDVLVVSAGATAIATVVDEFTATAGTSNAGTATLTAVDDTGDGVTLIDLTLAGGPNGYTILGDAMDGVANTLTGSAFADTINGGDGAQNSADDVDTLTGNGGADTFVFDVSQSNPIVLSEAPAGTPGSDVEQWDFDGAVDDGATAAFGANLADGSQSVTVLFRNDTTATSFTILDDATIDFTDGDALAARIATDLVSRGVAASYDAATDLLTLTGTAGQSVEITSIVPSIPFADAPIQDTGYDAGNDVPQVTNVTVGAGGGATAVAGEIYSITVGLTEGSDFTFEFTAVGGETEAQIATALEVGLDALSGEYTSVVAGNVITITDANADNGGFTVTLDNNPGISGTGASALGAGAGVWADAHADVITDFTSGVDFIDLGIAAGSNTNYLEAAAVADYALAYAAADAAFNGTVRYYLTSATDLDGVGAGTEGSGLLFFDANGDSTVDGVIALTGVTAATFDEQDIVA